MAEGDVALFHPPRSAALGPDGDLVDHTIAASAGTYTATASLNSGTWVVQLAIFAAAP
ncbi:MAG: hypothetical protein HYR72_04665 [Deltaproteobacteria bacterium]|nr:hypothetical protein [Deltaproteobacteria bacterium]MBI3389822.1 hypothetical protein [Deltaproteobacteria bacterium]